MSFRPVDLQVLLMQLQQAAHGSTSQKRATKNRESRQGDALVAKSRLSKEHISEVEKIATTDTQVREHVQPVILQGHANKQKSHAHYPTIVDKKLGKRIDISK